MNSSGDIIDETIKFLVMAAICAFTLFLGGIILVSSVFSKLRKTSLASRRNLQCFFIPLFLLAICALNLATFLMVQFALCGFIFAGVIFIVQGKIADKQMGMSLIAGSILAYAIIFILSQAPPS